MKKSILLICLALVGCECNTSFSTHTRHVVCYHKNTGEKLIDEFVNSKVYVLSDGEVRWETKEGSTKIVGLGCIVKPVKKNSTVG